MTPEDQNKCREIKTGRGRRRGMLKKELTDLQEDSAGFTRAKRFFGPLGYVYMNMCRLKSK